MVLQATIDMLVGMKLTGMAAELSSQLQDSSFNELSFEDRLGLLEIAEARCQRSMSFCTQYQSEGWYTRIDPNPNSGSPVSKAIMDRIIHNAYEVLVEGRVSMRECNGLKFSPSKGGVDDA